MTITGQFVGSLEYAAPEQIQGRDIGPRTDVYALGGVLTACLTGRPPYSAPSDAGLLFAHLNAPVPVPSERAAGVPVALDAVVRRAMAKEPEARFASAGDMARAARAALLGLASVEVAGGAAGGGFARVVDEEDGAVGRPRERAEAIEDHGHLGTGDQVLRAIGAIRIASRQPRRCQRLHELPGPVVRRHIREGLCRCS